MKTLPRILVPVGLALLALGCASVPPLNTAGVDPSLTPASTAAALDRAQGRRVAWGGVIIDSKNLAATSQVEVLAYPLDGDGRPQTDAQPLGRFLAVKSGYLEPLSYSRGKLASFVGTVAPAQTGKVGESEYRYPVMQVVESRLWPPRGSYGPQLHLGVGIILSN